MNDVRLVVLAHYPDIFQGFYESVNRWEPEMRKVLVRDGDKVDPTQDWHWLTLQGRLPFNYSANVNIGWKDAAPHDVILCGDDIRFGGPFLDTFRRIAYSDPKIGVVTIQFHGESPFVAGYWKREVLDAVGWMDEQFTGYGVEDCDFCHRMEMAGYHTVCTEEIQAVHKTTSTFRRREAEGAIDMGGTCAANWERYKQKWGDPEKDRAKESPDRWNAK